MLNVNNYPWASSSIDFFCVFCRWNDWQVDPDLQQNQASCHYWRTHWDHLRSCRFVSTNQDLFKMNFWGPCFFAIFETRNACVIIYVSKFHHQGTKAWKWSSWKALSYKKKSRMILLILECSEVRINVVDNNSKINEFKWFQFLIWSNLALFLTQMMHHILSWKSQKVIFYKSTKIGLQLIWLLCEL